jgi:hypothetical protein
MKRILIPILVVALIAGFGYFGFINQASAASPTLPSSAMKDVKLITVAEDVTLASGATGPDFVSEAIDAKEYREFKLYVEMTPGPGPTDFVPPTIDLPLNVIRVGEFPINGPAYAFFTYNTWNKMPVPPPSRYTMAVSFNGLYSAFNVAAFNDSGQDVEVSMYLLMAEE